MTKSWKQGGCHCGAVRWEAEVHDAVTVEDCDCSMCRLTGFLHVIVPADRFRLLSGEGELSEYCFNTGVARHLFCRRCGVKSFYVPRSHPDGYSLNLRCFDAGQFASVEIKLFDGRNWEHGAAALAHPFPD
ncbi:MAG: GFA family protein [Pseudomonadota bacterium]|nr:GFA family protein [Pseudomonadota bacterium]